MLPVNGARSELDCIGSSRSSMFAASRVSVEALLTVPRICTIVRIYQVLLDLRIVVVLIRVARCCTCHHGHERSVA